MEDISSPYTVIRLEEAFPFMDLVNYAADSL
jgi:hypothetical protein